MFEVAVFGVLLRALLLSVVVPDVHANPQSCADWCNNQYAPNSPGGWIDGTAVFCRGTANNCPGALSLLANSSFFDNYGNKCLTGNKYCCCGKSANARKTSEFLCCSEGNAACDEKTMDNNHCCPEGMLMNMNSDGCTCKGKSSTGMCASNLKPEPAPAPEPAPGPAPAHVPAHVPTPAPSRPTPVPSTPEPNEEQTDWLLLIIWGLGGVVAVVVIGYIALKFVLPGCCKCFDCCDLCDVAEFFSLGGADAE